MSELRITLLGEFSFVLPGGEGVNFAGDRPISLLTYLLLHRQAAVSRQQLAFTLWPDSSDSQARTNLRNLLYTLRQTMPKADSYLAADSMTIQWRRDAAVELDVAAFEAALAEARQAAEAAGKIHHLERAVELYKGDLLPTNYDDWIIPLREDLHQNYVDALRELVLLLEQQAGYRAAIRYAQRLLQLDPLDEASCVQLMRLHAHSGERSGVRRVYEACVETLRRELGIEPAAATVTAYEQFMRREMPTTEAAGAPAAPAPAFAPRPLPAQATPFIGREVELARIAELLADPACRLLNIAGLGGIGKTRLALQTAVGHQRVFADGVVFVPLGAAREAVHAVPAIAAALNLVMLGQGDPKVQLFNYLENRQLLLVLDSVDGFLDEIELLSDLLQATHGVVLLVTSRVRLNLQEEWLFPLDGLPVPTEGEAGDEAAMLENPAVRLFLHSARRLRTDFTPNAADLPALRRICELVNGMPLGLELAATWTRVLSCREIAHELAESIDFLASAHRNLPARHQSMRAVFDYSWSLLAVDQRALLAKLSVFRGGFTRAAAQEVAGATLPLLAALVDRSLVRQAHSGRYTMHELIRQYAADQLADEAERLEEVSSRHSDYYLRMLVGEEAVLQSGQQKEALARITADFSNVRLAWEWASARHKAALLRAASWSLWYFLDLRGLFQEGGEAFQLAEASLREALALEEAPASDLLVAHANMQTHRAYFTFRRGKTAEAEQTLQEALALLQRLDDEEALADALLVRGSMYWFMGAYAASAEVTREALAVGRRRERLWPIMIHTVTLGVMVHELGEYGEAYQLLEDGLGQARALGDPRAISFATSFLSRTAQALGLKEQAEKLLQEGLEQAVRMDDPFAMTLAWEQLGQVSLAQGQLEEAGRNFGEGIELCRAMGDDQSLVRLLNQLGDVQLQAGEQALAEALYREALATAAANEASNGAIEAVLGLARLSALRGTHARTWALAAVLAKEGNSCAVQAQGRRLQETAETHATAEQKMAVSAWTAAQPLALLIDDVLHSNLPV